MSDDRTQVLQLLEGIKRDLDGLSELLDDVSSEWTYEDLVYRFWHQSFKVYGIQRATVRMVEALRSLAPDGESLNRWFEEIIAHGTGHRFEVEHNRRWLEETRPMLEAFWHARFMVEMAVRYGRELDRPPTALPSGWAALLHLYDLR